MRSRLPAVPARPLVYAEGPVDDAMKGRVYAVDGWMRWSDRKKMRYLRRLAEAYGRDPRWREFVVKNILAGVQDRDYRGQAAAILNWMHARLRYINEPDEQLQSPWETLRLGFADCDDMGIFGAAAAEAVALPWRFVLAGRNAKGARVRWVEGTRNPSWGAKYAHIYLLFGWPPFAPTQWEVAEPTVATAELGTDVVMGEDTRGGYAPGASLPEVGMSGARFSGARFGAMDDDADLQDPSGVTVEGGALTRFWRSIPWSDVAVGVVEGIITTMAITWILKDRRYK